MENKYITSGKQIYDLAKKLYPICRSITGNGLRDTLGIIRTMIPLKIHEIPSGTKVFDWVIPEEWNIRDAYIKDSKGKRIADFKNSNLHVVNYSVPIKKKIHLKELKKHIYTLPEKPSSIPYVTSYYKKNWGFCLSHNSYKKLKEDYYEVMIDTTLAKGFLTHGELYIKGKMKDEVIFSTYICHPSLCNDNLSGIALTTYIAKHILNKQTNFSYRFLFIPETIGSISWLNQHENKIPNIKYGLIATCVGDSGISTYKRTRDGNTILDRIAEKVLIDSKEPHKIISFDPADGSDERQFSSPGFNLPFGSLMRTPYGCFDEYHTSDDNLSFIKPKYLSNSFSKYLKIIYIIENNRTYLNLKPKCEPQLGKRGLYRSIGDLRQPLSEKAIFWVLNYSDGKNSLLDIATRSNIDFITIKKAASLLLSNGLLEEINLPKQYHV